MYINIESVKVVRGTYDTKRDWILINDKYYESYNSVLLKDLGYSDVVKIAPKQSAAGFTYANVEKCYAQIPAGTNGEGIF